MSNYKSNLQTNNSALSANNIDLQSLIEQANNLPDAGGVELPTLTNEGTASDLLSGKQLIDQEGNIVTGNIPTLTENDIMIKKNSVIVHQGYFEDTTYVDIPTVNQSIPEIKISSNGLITASSTQGEGYVVSGTKSATKQLTTKTGTTYTPTTSNQTIASGIYLTGIQTIEGDSNLIAKNIKSGVSIFGVNGTYEGVTYENGDEVKF